MRMKTFPPLSHKLFVTVHNPSFHTFLASIGDTWPDLSRPLWSTWQRVTSAVPTPSARSLCRFWEVVPERRCIDSRSRCLESPSERELYRIHEVIPYAIWFENILLHKNAIVKTKSLSWEVFTIINKSRREINARL